MEEIFDKNSIRTFTGKWVNVFNVDPNSIDIIDIAHALSKEQRFGNHLPVTYSVAQHSIICSEIVPSEHKLAALLHDSSEAFLIDLPKPIKINMDQYVKAENNLMRSLASIFGFEYPFHEWIKKADAIMFEAEWNCLMLGKEPFPYRLLTQVESKEVFLQKYYELKKC